MTYHDIETMLCPHCDAFLKEVERKGYCPHCDQFRGPWCEEGCEECFPQDED